jgi:hypothetical protein
MICDNCGCNLEIMAPVWNVTYDTQRRTLVRFCNECLKNPLVGILKQLEKSLTSREL